MDRKAEHTWSVVMAAGEGSRLRGLTTTPWGMAVPKQFCSLHGGTSLLDETLQRARAIASHERICAVVAHQHRRWWPDPLCSLFAENVLVEPQNRGTANGMLLALLHILERDPQARIVFLPSDHHVCDEPLLAHSIRQTVQQLGTRVTEVVLLGMEPDEPDVELGYIVPGAADGHGAFAVEEFVEKPGLAAARALIDQGALWNAFIVAAQARPLLGIFEARIPEIVMEMRGVAPHDRRRADVIATIELYERLPDIDFSRHIAPRCLRELRVVAVPPCGWSDLGTPRRVAQVLSRLSRDETSRVPSLDHRTAPLDLANQYAAHNRLLEWRDAAPS